MKVKILKFKAVENLKQKILNEPDMQLRRKIFMNMEIEEKKMKVNIGCYPKNADEKRKIKVKIDKWDTWSADHTLALIIHPLLVKIKKAKAGIPATSNSDVPSEYQSETPHDEKRWEYILDEMIFAFEQVIAEESEWDWGWGNEKACERVQKGLELFGKYYLTLWT